MYVKKKSQQDTFSKYYYFFSVMLRSILEFWKGSLTVKSWQGTGVILDRVLQVSATAHTFRALKLTHSLGGSGNRRRNGLRFSAN